MKILEIQHLQESQVQAVVDLDKICLGGLWTAEGYLREIDSPNSSLLILNLIEASQKQIIGVGCVWSILEEAHITLLGIHPHHQRQGLGTFMLLSLLDDAIARNLSWATLEVSVNNQKALNLYKKFGFEAVGKRKGYYQSTGEDAIVLWLKNLQQLEYKTNVAQWQQELKLDLSNNGYHWY